MKASAQPLVSLASRLAVLGCLGSCDAAGGAQPVDGHVGGSGQRASNLAPDGTSQGNPE